MVTERLRYPVPANAAAVVVAWSDELAAYLGVPTTSIAAEPERHLTFPPETLRIELMDGSSVSFKWAFALVSESRRAIAVFTEHCGHHVFPYHEARVFADDVLQFEHVV